MDKPEMKAGIYIRCSNEAKERETLNTQRQACADYCKAKGWQVHDVYCDDGVTRRYLGITDDEVNEIEDRINL